MQPFLTYREQDSEGKLQYYILQKAFPHFVGLIATYPKENKLQAPVSGYNLYVEFSGTIEGCFVPSYRNIGEEMQAVILSMADWFYGNRIMENPSKYKKFKLHATSTHQ